MGQPKNLEDYLIGDFELDPEEFDLILKSDLDLFGNAKNKKIHILSLCSAREESKSSKTEQNIKTISDSWFENNLEELIISGQINKAIIPYLTKEGHYVHFEVDFLNFDEKDDSVRKIILIKVIDPMGRYDGEVGLAIQEIVNFFDKKQGNFPFLNIKNIFVASDSSDVKQQSTNNGANGSAFYVIENIHQIVADLDYRILPNTDQMLLKSNQMIKFYGVQCIFSEHDKKTREKIFQDQLNSSKRKYFSLELADFEALLKNEYLVLKKLQDDLVKIKDSATELYDLSKEDSIEFEWDKKFVLVVQKHLVKGELKIVVFFRELSLNEETNIEDFDYGSHEQRSELYDTVLKLLNKKINLIKLSEKRKIYNIEEVEEPEKENSEVLFLEKKSEVLKRIQESAKKLFDISKSTLSFKWNRYYDLTVKEDPNKNGLVIITLNGKKENEESANQEIFIDEDFDKSDIKYYKDILEFLDRELDLVTGIISFEIPEHLRPKAVIRAPLLPDLPNIDDIDAQVQVPKSKSGVLELSVDDSSIKDKKELMVAKQEFDKSSKWTELVELKINDVNTGLVI